MKITQAIPRKERDLNTPQQFIRAIGVSGIAHALLILVIALVSILDQSRRVVVPGYTVDLVTLKTARPHSLLNSAKKKKKTKHKKKRYARIKKKKPAIKHRKKIPHAKKIVPKKEKPKKIKPEPAPEPVKKESPKPEVPNKTVVTEGMEFPYVWYLKMVERKVRENWITHNVDLADSGSVPVVRFVIDKDGSVTSATMERSSGDSTLDKSVLQAVQSAQPFASLPPNYPGDSLAVHFAFNYTQNY